jgi:hypothetical protein
MGELICIVRIADFGQIDMRLDATLNNCIICSCIRLGRCMQPLRLAAIAGLISLTSGIANAGPCDTVQLDTNMIWVYNNFSDAHAGIQQAILTGGSAGASQIMQIYRAKQHGNALNLLNSCGPLDFLASAHRITGF